MDLGATKSFVNDNLTTWPYLPFYVAYSSLELAHGETIVSTSIAPHVLVCIGNLAIHVSLTAVPMIEGLQIILVCEWLEVVNPLIDWKMNFLVLTLNNQL